MLFTKSINIPLKLNIAIDNESIGEVRRTKFVGVFIDNKLNWKDHVTYISGKIARGIWMIKKARNYLNQDGLLALYHAFIYPYFTYCNHVWGATYKSYLQRIVILQNKIVRIISHVKPRADCKPLYHKLGIMKFQCINYYLLARFMYRLSVDQVPSLFKPFFQRNQELHNYSTRIADHFHIPLVKSDLGKTGIRFRGAVIWNSVLNGGICPEVSEAVFKKILKKLLQTVKIWSHKFLILGMEMQQIPTLFGNISWCSTVPFCLIFLHMTQRRVTD